MLSSTTGQGGQPARWRGVPGAVRVPEAQYHGLPGDAEGQGRHGAPAPQRGRGRDRVGHGEPLLRAALQVNGTERNGHRHCFVCFPTSPCMVLKWKMYHWNGLQTVTDRPVTA